jgi:hypothetical protein
MIQAVEMWCEEFAGTDEGAMMNGDGPEHDTLRPRVSVVQWSSHCQID